MSIDRIFGEELPNQMVRLQILNGKPGSGHDLRLEWLKGQLVKTNIPSLTIIRMSFNAARDESGALTKYN